MSIEKLLNNLQRSLDRFGCKVATMQIPDCSVSALGWWLVVHRFSAQDTMVASQNWCTAVLVVECLIRWTVKM